MKTGFNAVQIAVSNGPNPKLGGYDQAKEDELRDLVVDFAEAFSTTYQRLAENGDVIATDPDRRNYFKGNIKAASYSKEEVNNEPGGTDAPFGDYI
jgi:hypothetical protein